SNPYISVFLDLSNYIEVNASGHLLQYYISRITEMKDKKNICNCIQLPVVAPCNIKSLLVSVS
ncbi:hypothetical protein ACWAS2_005949, partial [Klebsiella michiganensis]